MSSLVWTVSLRYDEFTLHLNTTPTWVEAVSPFVSKVACLITCRLPFSWAYKLGSRMVFWLDDQQKELGKVSITKEQAFALQPGYWEFLFEDGDADV